MLLPPIGSKSQLQVMESSAGEACSLASLICKMIVMYIKQVCILYISVNLGVKDLGGCKWPSVVFKTLARSIISTRYFLQAAFFYIKHMCSQTAMIH